MSSHAYEGTLALVDRAGALSLLPSLSSADRADDSAVGVTVDGSTIVGKSNGIAVTWRC